MPEARPLSKARRSRAYASPRRQKQAAETKAAVLDAARTLFSERGWAGTGMREVASVAEVSVETVYSLFRSKPDLFQAAYDVAIVGDLEAVPVAERAEFQALGGGDRHEAVRDSARWIARIHQQMGGLERALREAAASDPSLGQLLVENEERRRSDTAGAIKLVLGRPPTPTERDGCWALASFEIYDLLVERSGWSVRRYADWLAERFSALGQRRTEREED